MENLPINSSTTQTSSDFSLFAVVILPLVYFCHIPRCPPPFSFLLIHWYAGGVQHPIMITQFDCFEYTNDKQDADGNRHNLDGVIVWSLTV
jgi:hypothetical protein